MRLGKTTAYPRTAEAVQTNAASEPSEPAIALAKLNTLKREDGPLAFLFVSHASADKSLIRPLLQVLIAEGETIWIDRPGAGSGNFGFDQAYIDANDIDHLQSGQPWSSSLQRALRASGAVLGCLSRSILQERNVLKDELFFADTAGKLVTCIVDDLPHGDLQKARDGLLDLARHQSPRVGCAALKKALDLRARHGFRFDDLPGDLRTEWEKVRNLLADIDRVRSEPRPLRSGAVEKIARRLRRIPVGPPLYVRHIPRELVDALANGLDTTEKMAASFAQTETVLRDAFPAGYTERQILVRRTQLPSFGTLPSEAFWQQTISIAGLKARRTVAAFLLTPMGQWAIARADVSASAEAFVSELERPGTFVET